MLTGTGVGPNPGYGSPSTVLPIGLDIVPRSVYDLPAMKGGVDV